MVKRYLRIVLVSIAAVLLIGFFDLLINSPGKIEPLTDASGKVIPHAIAEKNEIEIGGIRQGFFIRSENPGNPVILYLHGGPGSPELPVIIPTESGERLEKYFTVCYWDQRGAGLSYSKSIDPSTMTVDQMVQDTHEMTKYLQRRFKKNKLKEFDKFAPDFPNQKYLRSVRSNLMEEDGIGII